MGRNVQDDTEWTKDMCIPLQKEVLDKVILLRIFTNTTRKPLWGNRTLGWTDAEKIPTVLGFIP